MISSSLLLLLLWVSVFLRSLSSSTSLSSLLFLLFFLLRKRKRERERERETDREGEEGEREGLGSPKGERWKEEEKPSGPRLTTGRLPGPSSSNPNEGIEGIESLLDRQLYLPLRENLVWPGRWVRAPSPFGRFQRAEPWLAAQVPSRWILLAYAHASWLCLASTMLCLASMW